MKCTKCAHHLHKLCASSAQSVQAICTNCANAVAHLKPPSTEKHISFGNKQGNSMFPGNFIVKNGIYFLELHASVHIEDGRIGGDFLIVELYGTVVRLGMLPFQQINDFSTSPDDGTITVSCHYMDGTISIE